MKPLLIFISLLLVSGIIAWAFGYRISAKNEQKLDFSYETYVVGYLTCLTEDLLLNRATENFYWKFIKRHLSDKSLTCNGADLAFGIVRLHAKNHFEYKKMSQQEYDAFIKSADMLREQVLEKCCK